MVEFEEFVKNDWVTDLKKRANLTLKNNIRLEEYQYYNTRTDKIMFVTICEGKVIYDMSDELMNNVFELFLANLRDIGINLKKNKE